MNDGVLSLANFFGIFALLSWPAERCQDLVCPDQPVIEKASPVVEKSLDFALTSLEACKASRASAPSEACHTARAPEQHCYYFSLFWVGFICGSVVVVTLLLLVRFVRNLLFTPAAAPEPAALQALPAAAAAAPVRVIEPANPNTLRQLGLLR